MKKTFKISAASILFYIAAVVFLGIAVFYIWQTYILIGDYADSGQELSIAGKCNAYFTYCAPYFAYAIISYGIGALAAKVSRLSEVMALCVKDAQETAAHEQEER